ncbi:TonB-dependent outer membrane protein [gut metagenome]|uniref:TonB-dependent outer membrane protein n=1 Tax=gut metagenome TaxID=749906 RepID=J9GRG6_9ZZZZ
MKTKNMMMALVLLTTGNAGAEELTKDSLKVVDMEEVVVIATPKENRKLRELPVAATILSQENLRANQVNSVKNLTGVVPNLFIPDYGSKLTTSIYIRGIGSRINTPSVGLYVDNIPYIDKSAFDFNMQTSSGSTHSADRREHSTGATPWADSSRCTPNRPLLTKEPIFVWEQAATTNTTHRSPITTAFPTNLHFLPEVSTNITEVSLKMQQETAKR